MPAHPLDRLCRVTGALALALSLGGCAVTGPATAPEPSAWPPASGRVALPPTPSDADPAAASPDADPAEASTDPAVLPPAPASGDVVLTAMNFLDVRYRRGGDSAAEGFDCSGFTRHVYEVATGLRLPRRAQEQARAPSWSKVPRAGLQPGDLVFFNTLGAAFSHVGIYVGEGRFIHAPRTGASVRVEDMGGPYWRKRYDGARRPAEPAPALGAAGAPEGAVPGPPQARPAAAWPSPRQRPSAAAAPGPSR